MNLSQLAAWGVHLYTASGVVLALLALDAIARAAYGQAFAWMTLATFIDSTDGTLARRARVKEVVPSFDGAKLDDIVDYLNYVVVPIVLAVHAGLIPTGSAQIAIASAPLLASAYGFCQADAKTADHFFTGFPSYWNVVVFYLFILGGPLWFDVGVLLFLSVMVFVPIAYLYPSRTRTLQKQTYILGAIWGLMFVVLLLQFPTPSRSLAIVSLYFPAYYLMLSFYLNARRST